MDTLKRSRGQLVLVADEFGAIEGLVTPIDVFEAIAGEFPDEDELPDIVADGERTWKIDGAADLHHVEQVLETEGLIDEAQDSPRWPATCCRALAICPPGDACEYEIHHDHFRFEVLEMDGRRIALVRVEKSPRSRCPTKRP